MGRFSIEFIKGGGKFRSSCSNLPSREWTFWGNYHAVKVLIMFRQDD